MTLKHPKAAPFLDPDLELDFVHDLERQLPRLEHQPEPVHDEASAAGVAH